MAGNAVSAYLLLLLCMGLGMVMSRWAPMPQNAPAVLNAWVIRVALPAVVLLKVPELSIEWDLIVLALGPWWVVLGALLLFTLASARLGLDRQTVGCLVLTAGLCNTSFVGLPLILALRGPDAMGPAVIADQIGSFSAITLVGLAVAAVYSGGRPSMRTISTRVLQFPPFFALIFAALFGMFFHWPPMAESVLQRLADSMTPLALFSVGLQFRFTLPSHELKALGWGLGWKLIVGPATFWLFIAAWFEPGLPTSVAVLQAAMAPMITGGILAQQYGLKPALANAVVSYGILASFLTVPVFAMFLP